MENQLVLKDWVSNLELRVLDPVAGGPNARCTDQISHDPEALLTWVVAVTWIDNLDLITDLKFHASQCTQPLRRETLRLALLELLRATSEEEAALAAHADAAAGA